MHAPAPATEDAPAPSPSASPGHDAAAIEAAYARCTHLATTHYENFPVGRLVPARLRKHVHAVYAFARHADDLADEGYEHEGLAEKKRLAALNDWEAQLLQPRGTATEPIFIALHETMHELDLPVSLFTDLLSAFKQDVVKRRYANFDDVLDYCRRSANPIGRLVLLLHGYRDPHLHELSDHICTALQLANFWQDISVDLIKDRIYLPQNDMEYYGVTEEDLFEKRATGPFRQLVQFQVDRTQHIFNAGEPLVGHLKSGLRWEIRLTWMGGTRILQMIRDQKFDTLSRRPKITKWQMLPMLVKAWVFR
ncbi:squalene synthase HpnC [Verrucomicrobia bacterium LW23]|nr:squalene synthase HpnC [Verrucomicrobia bacterium LW23]